MSDQLLNKTVTILSVEKKATSTGKIFYKLKGDDNRSYQLWLKKADGSESKAYENLKNLENEGLGKVVEISYKEDSGTYEGKPVTYRTIVMIRLASEQPGTAQRVARMGLGEAKQAAED